ncbi:MAG: S41 family peptidase [Bacteroidia bacterium]
MKIRTGLLFVFTTIILFSFKNEEKTPNWFRYPVISPDGTSILFCYKGDIYKVGVEGGTAIPLTVSDAYDFNPIWSNDGKKISFASDRNGGFDVYVMSAEGGAATRLTYFSTNDVPQFFTSDNKNIVFQSIRADNEKFTEFPSPGLPELYSVPVEGGREKSFLTITADDTKTNKKGDKFIFHDRKGYEDPMRKHHTSSVARDVWMYDKSNGAFNQLTDFEGEDRNPVWSNDEKTIYYLSEKSGSFNVWQMGGDNFSQRKQISTFDKNPVRYLSISNQDVLCFNYNGDIFTQKPDETPKKVAIKIITDERYPKTTIKTITNGVSEMAVSPNGKEVAFVVHGEVFVTSIEGKHTKQITNTPEQERSIDFSPDGKSIVYASERDNIWGIYQTSLIREEEKYFFNSTILKEETIVKSNKESFQPKYSPLGDEVAFLEDRTAVKVINLKSKKARTIMPAEKNYSYADGDQSYDWSPDGKYLIVHFLQDGHWREQVGLVDSEGKNPIVDLTQSGFDNGGGKWAMNGKMAIWFSNRHGMKNVGGHGSQSDVYGLFFTKEAYDNFTLNKEEAELIKSENKEKNKDKKTNTSAKDKSASKDSSKIEPIKIEMEGIQDRKERLTIHSSHLADALVTPDGEKLLYLAHFEKGYDLWQTTFKKNETKLLLKLNAGGVSSMQFDKNAKHVYFVSNGTMIEVDIDKGSKKEIHFKAQLTVNAEKEREYFFEHMWRQVVNKFYVTDLQKTDWNYYKENYKQFLPSINNGYDFAALASEMLGELNASHTGCRYRHHADGDKTAMLAAFFDESYSGTGLKITEILDKSPLLKSGSEIKVGTIIEKINGVEIKPSTNYYQLLNNIENKNTLLSCYDEKTKKKWEVVIKPISYGEFNHLLYERWVRKMQDMTDKLSNGQIAYMHVQGMNNESYREFYDQVMGKYVNKKALIVDTRFNGGGWLHDDLATFLSGKQYINFVPRERKIGVEPGRKWNKPSAVLMCEGNYSDAHMFPVVYRTLGIGKLIGMPVPGTGTAVWWETLHNGELVFGIPQVGVMTMDGKYYENNQLEPDIKVKNGYKEMMDGKDLQLEAAVKELMK